MATQTPHTGDSDKQSRDDESERITRNNPAEDIASDDDDTEELLEEAGDAVTDMEAREMRRDQKYRTGGDDYSPGIDTGIDANAPKEDRHSS